MRLTVIIPTFEERPNIEELVRRTEDAVVGVDADILFVDDSRDGTAEEIRRVASTTSLPVRVVARHRADGGLSGAVVEGLRQARSDVCIVMDGDLQHPPEAIPELLARFERGDADVVAASRYEGGDASASGLAGTWRTVVSRLSNAVTRAMFPLRLAGCSDPMTGFFLVDCRRLDLEALRPRGFKILLEILARNDLRIAEIPFRFENRAGGTSKASARHGVVFLAHLARLRFGKMSSFALIGGIGAVANLGIMWALTGLGTPYVWAAVIAAEATIIGNFLLQERFVFADMRADAVSFWRRFSVSFAFNNAEAAVRIPILALLVETWHVSSILAAAITLAAAFVARFVFHALVVYAPRRSPRGHDGLLERLDQEAMRPGEL